MKLRDGKSKILFLALTLLLAAVTQFHSHDCAGHLQLGHFHHECDHCHNHPAETSHGYSSGCALHLDTLPYEKSSVSSFSSPQWDLAAICPSELHTACVDLTVEVPHYLSSSYDCFFKSAPVNRGPPSSCYLAV